MDFDDFLTIYLIFNGKSISQWEHHILSIEACDAIRPELNCFISMIISVDILCGFAPVVGNRKHIIVSTGHDTHRIVVLLFITSCDEQIPGTNCHSFTTCVRGFL